MTTTTTTTESITESALPLAPGRWTIDTAHSAVSFWIRHLGVSKVRGRFNDVDASLDVGADPSELLVEATVALASLDTGNAERDAHVRSESMLDVDRRPTMRFVSTAITGEGADWTMRGELTVGDITRSVTLDVEFGGVQDMMGNLHAGFGTTGTFSRKEFGLAFDLPAGGDALLADTVHFELDLQFLAPAS